METGGENYSSYINNKVTITFNLVVFIVYKYMWY